MVENNHGQIYAWAAEIAHMVRHEGRHDFTLAGDIAAASLCGLNVVTGDGTLLRIHAADLDLVFEQHAPPANDHSPVAPLAPHCRFKRGTPADLKSWHVRLGHLHSFLAPLREQRKGLTAA